MKLSAYIIFIITIALFYGCNSSGKIQKDDSFIFIERNAYTTNNYNNLEYYRLNKAKEFMDGYYVVGNDVTKWEEFELKEGLLNGDYIIYHPNGKMYSHVKYSNGKRNGEELNYSATGVLTKRSTYKNEVLVGSRFGYFENGKIQSESKYEDGISIETQNYDVLGHIVWQRFIKDSKTITQKIIEGKVYSEMVSSNYDDYETMKFYNEDGSTKLFLRMLEERDNMYILELNDNGDEIKRVDAKANPQEAMKYFRLINQ